MPCRCTSNGIGLIDPGPFIQTVDRPVGTGPPIASNGGVQLDEGIVNTLPNHPPETIIPDTREDMFSDILGENILGSSIDMGGISIPIWGIAAVGAYFMFSRGDN